MPVYSPAIELLAEVEVMFRCLERAELRGREAAGFAAVVSANLPRLSTLTRREVS